MGAPIAIIHGWNGGPEGFGGLAEFLRDSLGEQVSTIDAVYLAGGLVSYRSVLAAEEYLGGNYFQSPVDLFGS